MKNESIVINNAQKSCQLHLRCKTNRTAGDLVVKNNMNVSERVQKVYNYKSRLKKFSVNVYLYFYLFIIFDVNK